ncbi:hypothetical protein [Spirosoma areae]
MRTSAEIQAEMEVVQNQSPELKKLTSTSQVSFFRLLKNMWVSLVMAIEQRVDTSIAALSKAIAEGQVGSVLWYVATLKAFQYGDSVSLYDGRPGYPTVNKAKQIIAQATVNEQPDGRLLIKVAKNQAGVWPFQPLGADELIALKEYVRQVKYAGVAADIISLPADEMQLDATLEYDRQVLTADGRLLSDLTRIPPLEAIYSYARSLPFDSVFSSTGLTDEVQKKEGVLDFQVKRVLIRPAGASAWQEATREANSAAGHINVIAANITYV